MSRDRTRPIKKTTRPVQKTAKATSRATTRATGKAASKGAQAVPMSWKTKLRLFFVRLWAKFKMWRMRRRAGHPLG